MWQVNILSVVDNDSNIFRIVIFIKNITNYLRKIKKYRYLILFGYFFFRITLIHSII